MSGKKDFFISYTGKDEEWAKWIAWQLENKGYTTTIQTWDFKPSSNFVSEMQQALVGCKKFIAVMSPDYFQSDYCEDEWTAAFAKNKKSGKNLLLPVRIADFMPEGLLSTIVYVDLYGISEEEAMKRLFRGVRGDRAKRKPDFPPDFFLSGKPAFPGTDGIPERTESDRYQKTGSNKKSKMMYTAIAALSAIVFLLIFLALPYDITAPSSENSIQTGGATPAFADESLIPESIASETAGLSITDIPNNFGSYGGMKIEDYDSSGKFTMVLDGGSWASVGIDLDKADLSEYRYAVIHARGRDGKEKFWFNLDTASMDFYFKEGLTTEWQDIVFDMSAGTADLSLISKVALEIGSDWTGNPDHTAIMIDGIHFTRELPIGDYKLVEYEDNG